MKLSEIKTVLQNVIEVTFKLPNGTFVPNHFHVSEVGLITKNFIDCGGVIRKQSVANFQLWQANDFDHRLAPQKLLHIIALSSAILGNEDLEIQVEYQTDTIGNYDLAFNGTHFELVAKQTNCLAKDHCGIPAEQMPVTTKQEACCTPGGGCC